MSRAVLPAWALCAAAALVPPGVTPAPAFQGAPAASPLPEVALEGMDPAVRDQLEAARAQLDHLVANPDTDPVALSDAYGRAGRFYQLYDLPEPAEAAYRRALELTPDDFRWLYHLGVLQQDGQRLEDARRALESARAARPTDGPTRLRLGQVELARNRLDEAERWFLQTLELPGTAAAAAYGLGQVALLRRDPATAVDRFRQALELQPSATTAHYQLGLAYRALGEIDLARRHLAIVGRREVAFDDPLRQNLSALVAGAGALIARATDYRANGELKLAAESLRRALEIAPEDLAIWRVLVSTLTQAGDLDSAMLEMRALLARYPDDASTHYDLGTALGRRGDTARAIEHLERATEIDPGYADAHFNLASLLEDLGQLSAAEERYSRAAALGPHDSEARVRRAGLASRLGRADEAAAELEAIVAVEPENRAAVALLATVLGRAGRFADAAHRYSHAITLDPADDELWFGRAIALLLAERYAEARDHLESAAERYPESPRFAHLLARLLATSPDPEVRDGPRALTLATQALEQRQSLDHAETVAMALAELGRFPEAADLQRRILQGAEASGATQLLPALRSRLQGYERGEPCRAPWAGG